MGTWYSRNMKENTILKQLQTSEPVAFGGFSELHVLNRQAVKILEDACYTDVLEECHRQNIAADAGLAPRVHAVAKLIDEVVVVMDVIDTDVWYHPDAMDDVAPTLLGELNEYQQSLGLRLFCRLLQAGLIHADFHSGNWFMNDEGRAMAIDFGIASELHEAPKQHLKRAVLFLIPCLAESHARLLVTAWETGLEETRETLKKVAAWYAN